MFFSDLRDVVIQRMAEYDNRVAAPSTGASRDNEVVLTRMKTSYRKLYSRARRANPIRFSKLVTFNYTANAEYIDVATVPTPSLANADILGLYDMTTSESPEPLVPVGEREWDRWLTTGRLPESIETNAYGFFIDGQTRLHLLPKPSSALPLRARYVITPSLSAVTTSTWTADSPSEFPEEHHELVALETAISFLAEVMDPPSSLVAERDVALGDFMEWASDDRKPGTRRIIEVD